MNVTIGQGIGSHFEDRGNGKWYCKTTKVEFWGGNLAFWRSYGGLGGLPLTGEIKLSPNSAAVVCERWIQIYDPNREVDHPYETGNVYLLHIDGGKGQALIAKNLTDALNAQIAGLQQQITALKAQVAAGIPADYQATKDQLAQTSARLQLYVQSVKLVQSTLQKL